MAQVFPVGSEVATRLAFSVPQLWEPVLALAIVRGEAKGDQEPYDYYSCNSTENSFRCIAHRTRTSRTAPCAAHPWLLPAPAAVTSTSSGGAKPTKAHVGYAGYSETIAADETTNHHAQSMCNSTAQPIHIPLASSSIRMHFTSYARHAQATRLHGPGVSLATLQQRSPQQTLHRGGDALHPPLPSGTQHPHHQQRAYDGLPTSQCPQPQLPLPPPSGNTSQLVITPQKYNL